MKRHIAKIRTFHKNHFLGVECGGAFVVTVVAAFLCRNDVTWLIEDMRADFYAAFVSLFGTMLGFSITAISIFLVIAVLPGLRRLRESEHFPYVRSMFTFTNIVLGLGTLCAILALLFDRKNNDHYFLAALMFGFAAMAVAAVARLIWLTAHLTRHATDDDDDEPEPIVDT